MPFQGTGRRDKQSGHHYLTCCVLHSISIDVRDPFPIDIVDSDDDDMDQSFNGDVSPTASDDKDNIMEYMSF